jgi:hypothetical protein
MNKCYDWKGSITRPSNGEKKIDLLPGVVGVCVGDILNDFYFWNIGASRELLVLITCRIS